MEHNTTSCATRVVWVMNGERAIASSKSDPPVFGNKKLEAQIAFAADHCTAPLVETGDTGHFPVHEEIEVSHDVGYHRTLRTTRSLKRRMHDGRASLTCFGLELFVFLKIIWVPDVSVC